MLRLLILVFLLLPTLSSFAAEKPFKIACVTGSQNPKSEEVIQKILERLKQSRIPQNSQRYTLQESRITETVSQIRDFSPDVILSFGSWQTDVLCEHFKETPIFFALVYRTDALDEILEKNKNLRGVFSNVDFNEFLTLLRQFSPELKRIGVLYSRKFFSRLSQNLQTQGKACGVEWKAIPLETGKDLPDALEKGTEDIDAFYCLPDPLLLNKQVFKKIVLYGALRQFFIFTEYPSLLQNGALIASNVSSEECAEKITRLLKQYLESGDILSLPVLQNQNPQWLVNEKILDKMDMEIPAALKHKLKKVKGGTLEIP